MIICSKSKIWPWARTGSAVAGTSSSNCECYCRKELERGYFTLQVQQKFGERFTLEPKDNALALSLPFSGAVSANAFVFWSVSSLVWLERHSVSWMLPLIGYRPEYPSPEPNHSGNTASAASLPSPFTYHKE